MSQLLNQQHPPYPMHVLLTNDDGPLNDFAAPYIKYLVDEIKRSTDWDLSIVVPDQQRSWIGKAHFAGKTLTSTYIYTGISTDKKTPAINAYKGPFNTPQAEFATSEFQEWCLLDSTPAACADIGIHHLYSQTKNKPIDLVLSGPNFGKNSSNLYIMTSGTVGAAIEAVTHGVPAIAMSYSFNNLDHDYDILKEAAKISVRLVRDLYQELKVNDKIDLFSINIPLVESLKLGTTKVKYAPILRNSWKSIYSPAPELNELGQQQFVWNPDFKSVYKHGLQDFTHTDSRILLEEGISITPLNATFHAVEPLSGEHVISDEVKVNITETSEKESLEETVVSGLQNLEIATLGSGDSTKPTTNGTSSGSFSILPLDLSTIVDGDKVFLITTPSNSYTFTPLLSAFQKFQIICTDDIKVLQLLPKFPNLRVFHYGDYEDLDIDVITNHPSQYFIPSYIYRKALIRKHFLANTIHHYTVKNPTSILTKAVPESYQLEVDYAEFLDDSLDEAYELRDEINAGDRTWILKPSMSDKGQGIRLFKSIEQLQDIFDSFEENEDEEEENDDDNGVIISQLRHFVVQEYKSHPLLLSAYNNRKFHLRTYIVCQGNLKVFVCKNILTLFAGTSYKNPDGEDDTDPISMDGHLTNTCLQTDPNKEEPSLVAQKYSINKDSALAVPFWDLQDENISSVQKTSIFEQVCEITADLFKAATSVDKINFQPMENAVEIFGVDFLVNEDCSVTLLEVNSYPDFKQTGDSLKFIICDLFERVAEELVYPMLEGIESEDKAGSTLIQVLDL